MNNVEEQILSYPHLAAEKRREVDAYVEDHPEWASLLRDVRSLESLRPGSGAATSDNSTDPVLTTYVVAQYFQVEDVSPALEKVFRELEDRLQEDPSFRERADEIRQRLEEAEDAVDPVHHFEDVTGYSLSPSTAAATREAEGTSASRSSASDRDGRSSAGSLIDQLLTLPLGVRLAGGAIALLLGTYVGLFAASEVSKTTLDRLATVEVSDRIVQNYSSTKTRSVTPAPETTTVDELYLEAVSTLRTARTSTLGLFPSYDIAALRRAERQLTEVLKRTEEGSFLALEARFYLGKVYLAQERVQAAYDSFETVVEREGRKAEEARTILRTLEDEYRIEGAKRGT